MHTHSFAFYNLVAAWVGVSLGMITGAIVGLQFDRATFAGGYTSWPRRLMRLGHISFFGLAFINALFYLTFAPLRGFSPFIIIGSLLLIAGAITMPLVCYLSAWRPAFRHAFFVPVALLFAAALLVTFQLLEVLP